MILRLPLALLLSLLLLLVIAIPVGAHPEAGDDEIESGGLKVKLKPALVMVGDDVEVEASFEVELDDEESEDDQDDFDGEEPESEEPTLAVDETGAVAVVPTAVTFTVDYGDGVPVEALPVTKQDGDAEEFEAEAEGRHAYAEEGVYGVTVTATPDVGDPTTVELAVEVTTDPVPYPRDGELACPDLQVPASGFADVGAASVHGPAIDCLAWWGTVQGKGAGVYAPGSAVSRAQMATFLARLLERSGVELPDDVEDVFDDDDGNAHEEAINQLTALRLISGTADGGYDPAGSLTRAQMATLLVRIVEYRADVPLTSEMDYFLDDAGNAHESAINLAAAAGLTTGRDRLVFAPGASLTRAQLATFLVRSLDVLVDTAGVTY